MNEEYHNNIKTQFIRYVSQNVFGMLGISCYIIVDTFFISQIAGANGITILNLILPIFNLIFAIGSMLGVGSAIRFAVLRAQKQAEAEYYFFHGILWACIASVIFVLLGMFAPEWVLKIMGADTEIVTEGLPYVSVVLMFAPFFMCNHVVGAFVRNDNAPTLAMVATLAGSISNIIFDYIFMYPCQLGLFGAALATGTSPIISILICSTHFFGKKNTIQLRLQLPSVKRLVKTCGLGTAAFIGEFSSGVTIMVFNYLILGIAGNIGVAAYGVIANYALIATAIFNGVAQGTQPLISREYGAGNVKVVRKLRNMAIFTAIGIAICILLGVYVGTAPLVELFNGEHNPVLAENAFVGMRIYFIGYILAGFNIIGTGYLSAIERPQAAFVSSILRGVIAVVAFSILLSIIFEMNGIWMAFPAAELFTAIVTAVSIFIMQKKPHGEE